MAVYGIQFWIECKGGSKTADELSVALDDLVYDGNLSLGYSNHSIMGAGLFTKNAVQNNFESIREILDEFADKIKYVSEWEYEDSSDVKWGVHTLGESNKHIRGKLMKNYKTRKLTERFNPPRDWDFDEMLGDYGIEFLNETNPDYAPYDMDEFNDLTSYRNDPLEAITRAFYGERYHWKNDSFNPNDEYFAYNGYGNLVSINKYDLDEYLNDYVDEEEFYNYCVDNGYFESEDEE